MPGSFFVILMKENSYLLQCELSVNYRKVTVIMLKYKVGDLYANSDYYSGQEVDYGYT